MIFRRVLQGILEKIQFAADSFLDNGYQPLPWVGIHTARRGEGTIARWNAIRRSLSREAIYSGMDIGCNVGFFCFALADMGIPMLGVDLESRYLRIAQYTARRLGIPIVGFCQLRVTLETIRILPTVDLVLCLSVWHHWVKEYGLESADLLLMALWSRTGRVLYFETGETEMSEEFGMPNMGSSTEDWLSAHLAKICSGGRILHLGTFKAFAPFGDEVRNVVYRNMYKISRDR